MSFQEIYGSWMTTMAILALTIAVLLSIHVRSKPSKRK